MADVTFGQNVSNWDDYSRTHWGGAGANIDIHLEEFKGLVDGAFDYDAFFAAHNLAQVVQLQGTNTYRWDRDGAAVAYGRSPGEVLVPQRFINEKVTTVVERAIYARHVMDRQDDWTSPDRMPRIARAQGQALAKANDVAHMTKLIHATEWKAPADLKKTGAFHDGVVKTLTGFSAEKDRSNRADMILNALYELHEHGQRTDQDMGKFVALIAPEWFHDILNYDKNISKEFSDGNGNFARRQIAYVNGFKIIETPRIDFTPVTTDNQYGAEFVRTAAQAKTGLILFNPEHTLMDIQVHGTQVKTWENDDEWARKIDTFRMNKPEIRRGDSAFALRKD